MSAPDSKPTIVERLGVDHAANKLRALALWFDVKDAERGVTDEDEVQRDLLLIADYIQRLEAERDGWKADYADCWKTATDSYARAEAIERRALDAESALSELQGVKAERDEARSEANQNAGLYGEACLKLSAALGELEDAQSTLRPARRTARDTAWKARALAAEAALTLARGEMDEARRVRDVFDSASDHWVDMFWKAESRATSLLALVGEAETALTTISNGEGYIHEMTLDEVDAIIVKLKAALHG